MELERTLMYTRIFLFSIAILSGATSLAAESACRQNSPQTVRVFAPLSIESTTDGLGSDSPDDFQVNDFLSQPWQSGMTTANLALSRPPTSVNSDSTKLVRLDREHSNIDGDRHLSSCQLSAPSNQTQTISWHPLDTLSLFGGLEGSKQPQDFGVNANFGSRWAANWGFPLLAEYGIGAQLGTSINHTDNAVQVFDRVGETSQRTQSFSTVGVFQRRGYWSWGFGYDFLYESYYDQFFLGQWRGKGGYDITSTDQVGVWFTVSQKHDSGMFLNIPVTLTPLTQGSIYWQHQFLTGARITGWAGVSEGHAQANLALGDLKKSGDQFVFGAEIDVPLNQYLALYGQANFISPASSGTVDSYLGLAVYPGGHAFPATRNPFTPLLALANSTMFATDIKRD